MHVIERTVVNKLPPPFMEYMIVFVKDITGQTAVTGKRVVRVETDRRSSKKNHGMMTNIMAIVLL